ncbi:glycosyltransferase [Pediococcus pentosaceus]|uniref:glycosyltransferase family 2 protein n=1 Tax=Pediococcus pentosaceus TaxID=1255 RepID=UPI0006D8C4F5|nr:glycosyltransferase family 2 protein [Pediococcus pentosaceus]ANI98167.1 hypothetical protein AN278_006675 [Pediococcus pentosaceus]KQB82289.1 hypothetical protein AN278_02250 [Pediococcus pentosaceus]MDQ7252946.1 glycosyltransferase [Pediococcus pentosaceus]MDY8106715.1 glycosyltransferase family 2 protein [Pediococcus pentosaceus]UQA99544.1 glycosyltransferase [Pediococcus pentosaceus]
MFNLSLIIPTYNAELYIPSLLKELAKLKKTEIIFIDDGSVDNTVNIIQENLKLLNRENTSYIIQSNHGGVSKSRNLGIKKAKGRYLTFIDADDSIDVVKLMELKQELNSENSDVIFIQKDLCNLELDLKKDFYRKDFIEKFVLKQKLKNCNGFIKTAPWSKFFSRKLVMEEDIEFPLDVKFGEDLIFTLECILKAGKITWKTESFYRYRQNPESVSREVKFNLINNAHNFYSHLESLLGKNCDIRKQCVSRSLIKDVERAVISGKNNTYIKELISSTIKFGYSFKNLNNKQKLILKAIVGENINLVKVIVKLRYFHSKDTEKYEEI